MKKLIYFAFLILAVCACSKDDSIESNNDNNDNQQKVEYSIVGVWESNNYFVSFNEENFCCAYFDDKYLDCGTYRKSDNVITTNNTYYSKQTKYSILELNDKTMKLQIDYLPLYGNAISKTMEFTKNNDIIPAIKDHSLVGKSYTSLVWLGEYNNSTWSFETYNTGTHSMSSGAASKYPLRVFYIFINNILYYQTFQTTQQMPTIGGWNPSTNVSKRTVSFSSNGSISSI